MNSDASNYQPCNCILCIMPPDMLEAIKRSGNAEQKAMAESIEQKAQNFRNAREIATPQGFLVAPPVTARAAAGPKRKVYNSQNAESLQRVLVREEGDSATGDREVDEAYDGAGATYNLYLDIFERDSLDGNGMELISNVHYGDNFENAFWDGNQMVYGDGGMFFKPLTSDIAVIGHEFSHGVVQFSGGLIYRDQSGALNEHFADVFGSLTKQYSLKQEARDADWLIGQGLLLPDVKGEALRSMRAPGTAYNDPVLGKDSQPYHMNDYVVTNRDNGGVHINSGIPNHAFYLLSMMLGGNAWDKAGQIWYKTMQQINNPLAKFTDWAELTVEIAIDMFGRGSMEAILTRRAWKLVGINV
ncbi:MAG: M4 family metallopeptidase [Xenococcus sp. MO_188.B8]|nr:M4 family metallopeptidase [Xenococcus sp. MO_188.B8]